MNRMLLAWMRAAALVGLVSAVAPPVAAQTASGGAPGAWLTNYAGARTLGMGGAFVATADDALGVLWNPAGLQYMDQNQLMFENVQLFEDASMNSFAFAVPGNWLPSMGISMVTLRSGEFQRTNELNDDLGTFGERETAYLVTLAKGLTPRFAVGANVKVIQQTVEDFSAGGIGLDLGAIACVTPSLRFGVSAANLGGPKVTLRDTPEQYETMWRGGAALELFDGRALMSVDLSHTAEAGAQLHAGTEYWIMPGMALRVGLLDERMAGGVSYRFAPRYQLDYAFADHPLGISQRVGVSYRFGGFFASSTAEPELFSPLGERSTTQILLNARTKSRADRWTLEVLDKAHRVVRRFGGAGLPPSHVQWDGKDETGLPVADGEYTYRLMVKDKDGRIVDGPARRITIATEGPQGDVPVVVNP
jgi:FlgD Ig-like domain